MGDPTSMQETTRRSKARRSTFFIPTVAVNIWPLIVEDVTCAVPFGSVATFNAKAENSERIADIAFGSWRTA
jgi:hypothetical protein